ncbi:MAG: amidohydrolase family protein [Pseudomonadota bacterium]
MSEEVIDLHAHVVLEAGFEQAGKFGPELGRDQNGVPFFRIGQYQMKPMDYRGTVFMDTNKRLEKMAAMGITRQLLSPNPLTMFHHIPADVATRFCQIHNDAMAELVSQHPEQLLGAACLPMQDVDAANRELERCTQQLGLVAAYTGTDFPCPLDDPSLDDFYRTLVQLNVPLFLHPASSGGDAGPNDPRLNRFNLTILLGYPYEEMLAIATLLFGAVYERHPELDLCISHGGGGIAYFLDRFIGMSQFGAWVPESIKSEGIHQMLQKLWFDAHVDGDAAHSRLLEVVGHERLVYGTNFGGWDTPSAADDFARSLSPNARQLLRLSA